MAAFILSLVLMLAAFGALAIGRLGGRPGLRGSCGALAGFDGGGCSGACRRGAAECPRAREKADADPVR